MNMNLKFINWLIRGSLVKRVVLRISMFVLAMIIVSLLQMAKEVRVVEPILRNVHECPLDLGPTTDSKPGGLLNSASRFLSPVNGASCEESRKLTKTVFKWLIEKKLVFSGAGAKTLCVGERSASNVMALMDLGFFTAVGVKMHPYFSLFKRRFIYELNFEDDHFDFVFSGDLDKVSVPSLLVMEIERVLRPGGAGVILMASRRFYCGGLITSIPVESILKNSEIVHICKVGSFTIVIFKKKLQTFTSFEHFQLPSTCLSVVMNKPFMKNLEPLMDKKSELSYLPKRMNITSRSKLVYINIGAGEYAQTSIAKMSESYYSDKHSSFDVFVIEHRLSVIASFVTDPGITFVYDPTLSGAAAPPEISSEDNLGEPYDEEKFEFVPWFEETVGDGDFVVLMMNAKLVELNILVELFKTGAICRVDELFLRCSDEVDECVKILESLRKNGVYVHQW